MNITIVGGLGYIGGTLVAELEKTEHTLKVVDFDLYGVCLERNPCKTAFFSRDVRNLSRKDFEELLDGSDALIWLASPHMEPERERLLPGERLMWERTFKEYELAMMRCLEPGRLLDRGALLFGSHSAHELGCRGQSLYAQHKRWVAGLAGYPMVAVIEPATVYGKGAWVQRPQTAGNALMAGLLPDRVIADLKEQGRLFTPMSSVVAAVLEWVGGGEPQVVFRTVDQLCVEAGRTPELPACRKHPTELLASRLDLPYPLET